MGLRKIKLCALGSIVPALRTECEGRGTHFTLSARDQRLGHPPEGRGTHFTLSARDQRLGHPPDSGASKGLKSGVRSTVVIALGYVVLLVELILRYLHH
jgi:hypothetical protein